MAVVVDTRPGYRVFCAVAEMRGPRLSDVARSCGLPTSRTRRILNVMLKTGLVCAANRRFYLTGRGVATVARQNRRHHQSVRPLVTQAPASGGTPAPVLEKRDTAINRVHQRFQSEGFRVGDGRRLGIGPLTSLRPCFPDLWVEIALDVDRGPFVLHAVLVDPSVESESAIKTRLRDFRGAYLTDPEERPLLVIARNETAAERFWRAGDELVMMVAMYGEFLKGDLSGPNSVWLYRGQRADVDRLALLVLSRAST